MLDFSRRDAENVVVVSELLQRSIELCGYIQFGSEVEMSLETEPNLMVRGSFSKLQQAILNGLVNAYDVVEEIAEPAIVLGARGEDGAVVIEIKDNGSKVGSDTLERVFEPFFTTKSAKGAGIGLPITREIVRQCGGDVEFSSTDEGGVLRLTLPSIEG